MKRGTLTILAIGVCAFAAGVAFTNQQYGVFALDLAFVILNMAFAYLLLLPKKPYGQ